MTERKRIIINTIATYTRSLFGVALGLFSVRWVLAALGKTDFGLWGVIGNIIVFVVFLNRLMSSSIARYYAYVVGAGRKKRVSEASEELMKWFNVALFIHSALPLLLICLGYPIGEYAINHWLVIPEDRVYPCILVFRIAMITAFINMVAVPFISMYQAHQLIAELSIMEIFQAVAQFICAYFLCRWRGDRLVIYALYMSIIPSAVTLILVFRAVKLFPYCRIVPSYLLMRSYLKRLFVYAGGELFGNIGWVIRDNGMPFLVNIKFGPIMNSAYTVSNQIAGQTSSLSSALLGALMPAVTSAEGEGEHQRAVKLSFQSIKFGVLLILLFAIPLMIEMDEVLALWLGRPPPYAGLLCRCSLIALICHKLGWGQHLAILAVGRVVLYQLVVGFTGGLGLFFAWVFVKIGLGPMGIGLSFVIVFLIMSIERAIFGEILCGMSFKCWLKGIVSPILTTIFIVGLVLYGMSCIMPPSIIRIFVTTIVGNVLLLILSWCLILDVHERFFLLSCMKRILGISKGIIK